MNPNNPLAKNCVIPAQAGIQLIKKISREAGQHRGFSRYAEGLSRWIPAYAGMTGLFPFRLAGLPLDSRLRGNDGIMDNLR